MAKLFWFRFLIVLCITACLVTDSIAPVSSWKGGVKPRRLTRKFSLRNKLHGRFHSVACPNCRVRLLKRRMKSQGTKAD
ncbi:hypothetical protein ACROYT_G019049 [Oculina patagonica]